MATKDLQDSKMHEIEASILPVCCMFNNCN